MLAFSPKYFKIFPYILWIKICSFTIGIKLIIDILNSTDPAYIPRLLNNLAQYTVVCNTDNPKIGGEMVEIFSYPLQVTTSLVVGYGHEKCKNGGICKYEAEEK